jgi:hypothetical protein
MPNPLSMADKYRKVAGEFSDRAKSASSVFLRSYYQRVVERYLLLAEDELRLADSESVSAGPRGRDRRKNARSPLGG